MASPRVAITLQQSVSMFEPLFDVHIVNKYLTCAIIWLWLEFITYQRNAMISSFFNIYI